MVKHGCNINRLAMRASCCLGCKSKLVKWSLFTAVSSELIVVFLSNSVTVKVGQRFCSHRSSWTFASDVEVIFHSDGKVSKRGFVLMWAKVRK